MYLIVFLECIRSFCVKMAQCDHLDRLRTTTQVNSGSFAGHVKPSHGYMHINDKDPAMNLNISTIKEHIILMPNSERKNIQPHNKSKKRSMPPSQTIKSLPRLRLPSSLTRLVLPRATHRLTQLGAPYSEREGQPYGIRRPWPDSRPALAAGKSIILCLW